MDFHLFGGWHLTVFPTAWVLLASVLIALALVILVAKKLMAR